jgi:hypothetical protein
LRQESRLTIFENRVLRRIFGPKKDEVTGDRRKLPNEELIDLYSSPNIIRFIKSRRMRWAENLGHMGSGEMRIGFWWGNVKKRDHLENPGVDGSTVLKWIFRKWELGARTRLIWLGVGKGDGLL